MIPLMNLSSDIPFKLFWIPSYYQPFFEFSQDQNIIENFLNTCFIFGKGILNRNNSYSIANKLKNSLSSEAWSGIRHVFSRNEQLDLDFNFGTNTQQLECGLTPTDQDVLVQATFMVTSKQKCYMM